MHLPNAHTQNFDKILLFKNFMAAKMESENVITPSLSIFAVIYSILSPDS